MDDPGPRNMTMEFVLQFWHASGTDMGFTDPINPVWKICQQIAFPDDPTAVESANGHRRTRVGCLPNSA